MTATDRALHLIPPPADPPDTERAGPATPEPTPAPEPADTAPDPVVAAATADSGAEPTADDAGADADTDDDGDDDGDGDGEAEPVAAVASGSDPAEESADTDDAESAVDDRAAPAGEADRTRRTAVLATLGVLAVALTVLTGYLAVGYQRAQARSAAEAEVLAPAKAAAARILSYDYRHIEQDATASTGLLTGAFRGQYETVMRQQIVPQAPRQRAVVAAEVLAAGVSGVSPDGKQAFVVIFANQTVSNTATPQPRVDQVRVRLTLDRVGDQWLVSKVDAL